MRTKPKASPAAGWIRPTPYAPPSPSEISDEDDEMDEEEAVTKSDAEKDPDPNVLIPEPDGWRSGRGFEDDDRSSDSEKPPSPPHPDTTNPSYNVNHEDLKAALFASTSRPLSTVCRIRHFNIYRSPFSDEDLERYNRQVEESGGYDVDPIRLTAGTCHPHANRIRPIPEQILPRYENLAHIAIKAANKVKQDGPLIFNKVVKMNQESTGYVVIYITLEAMDTVDGKAKSYLAKVVERPGKREPSVVEFKLKPEVVTVENKG